MSDAARDRLRRYALLGVTITGMVLGTIGGLVAFADGAIDPAVAALFAPDIAIGLVILWQVFVLRRLETAIVTYAAYLAINYAFLSVHANGFEVFQEPWIAMPPLLGFYLGGRRLGVVMTIVIGGEALVALVVHHAGIGHHLVEMPPSGELGAQILVALGSAEVLTLINIFELRRDREHVELDSALAELDVQTQTMVTLVESSSDVIVLVDEQHRVVLHNRAASELGVTVGSTRLGSDEHALAMWTDWLASCARDGHARVEHTIAGRVFELSFSRIAAAERVVGFTLIARDISARRESEAALRKLRGQLLDASRRAGIAESAAALVHNVGNALNGAMVASSLIVDHATALRAESLHRAVEEIDRGALSREDERAAQLRGFLRGFADSLAERKLAMVAEAQAVRASVHAVADALGAQAEPAAVRVFDDVSLDDIIASALSADDCTVSRNLAATGTIVTDRQRLVEIVASLFAVCRGDGMHVAVSSRDDGVAFAISPSHRTAWGVGSFAHGKPLHAAALAATALGGSLRHEDAAERESFVLELPRVAPAAD